MISQGEGCRELTLVGGGWQHTRQTLEKSPTSKLYTTWAHILSDRNVFAPRGGGETAGSNAPGAFLVFFGGHLPQTSAFRSAKEILVVSFAAQPRAFILSDRNIIYTPPGGENNGGV